MSIHTIEHCKIADETEKIAYERGAEDMRKALCTIRKSEVDGGMPTEDVEEIFGTIYCTLIIKNNSALDIITKVKQWEKEKENFKPGDEIEIVDPTLLSNGETRIITKVGINSIHLIDPITFNVTWIEKEHAKKTGKL